MNAPPVTVQVELGPRSYQIDVGSGNLAEVAQRVAALGDVSHVVIVTDENVQEPHAMAVGQALAVGAEVDVVAVPPGETSKSVETAFGLWEGLLELGADRRTLIAAVGGGVVGDLAGFLAATYARGLRFFQVPTSLLAQVDSSVGGKVGINLPGAKNMVGAFLQPVGVLIDTQVLDTLPDREYRSGLAEVVKYGVILDAGLFTYLEENVAAIVDRDHHALRSVVARCCRLKADVVEQDEREETGLRAVLNYGHTFGHALEAVAGYGELLHGEAVAIGMVCAARLAQRLGRVAPAFSARQEALLRAFGLPVAVPSLDREALMAALSRDKKAQHGHLRLILPRRLGAVELAEGIEAERVRAAWEA